MFTVPNDDGKLKTYMTAEVEIVLGTVAPPVLGFLCSGCSMRAVDVPGGTMCSSDSRGRSLAMSVLISEKLRDDREVDTCPVCEGHEFYVRKDFDPKLGLAVIITGALVSAGFYWYGMDLVAYGVLGGVALLDLVVYRRLRDLSVCYRCHAEFRGTYARTAPFFDLHTADELELEWARKLGKR